MGMYRCKTAWAIAVFFCLAAAAVAADNLLSIQIKNAPLRISPSFLAAITAALNYGDRVVAIESRDAWVKVNALSKKAEGWLHASALTTKQIILTPGADDVAQSVGTDELVLAGKGFSKQIEGAFQSRHPQIDYTWINQMEQMVVTSDQMKQFLKDGHLSPQGGFK